MLLDAPSIKVQELYATEDLPGFYAVVSGIIREHFNLNSWAIFLYDRHRTPFLESRHGPVFGRKVGGAEADFDLKIDGQDFGFLRLPPVSRDQTGEVTLFCESLARALYFHKVILEQGKVIDDSLAQVQALKTMSELLGELDRELVLNRILKFFIDLFEADVGAALLYEGEESVVEARWGIPDSVLQALIEVQGDQDHDSDGTLQRLEISDDQIDQFSLKTVLSMPIKLKHPFRAELYLVSGDDLTPGGREQELTISCQVMGGIALQKALDHQEQIRQHRLSEQLHVARDIQQHYLPTTLPRHRDLEIAGRSLPAQFVGGDYFDALELANGEILALIADVSGKGIQGAIRMAGLRAILHSLPCQNPDPQEALERLNLFLNRDAIPGQFITACCVSFRQGEGSFKLASAGHDPAILMSRDGSMRELECSGGLPLGMRPDQNYPITEVTWQPGDRLLIYTDGIVDTRNKQREQFGIERVTANFQGNGERTPEEDLEHLFATLESFRGKAPWADDLTMMTFKHL